MDKKKNVSLIECNYTNNYNYEVDYDKLANAIVKKDNFTAKIKKAIVDADEEIKKKEGSKTLTSILAIFTGVFILAASVVLAIVVCVLFKFRGLFDGLYQFLFWVFLISVVLLIVVLLISAFEIFKEKDKNYIVAIFSGIVSFVALIIAFIALFQDNGTSEIIEILNAIKESIVK